MTVHCFYYMCDHSSNADDMCDRDPVWHEPAWRAPVYRVVADALPNLSATSLVILASRPALQALRLQAYANPAANIMCDHSSNADNVPGRDPVWCAPVCRVVLDALPSLSICYRHCESCS
jgi:hypothetical protein